MNYPTCALVLAVFATIASTTHAAPASTTVGKNVLFIMTNADRMGPELDHPTGNYLPEFAHPYRILSPYHNIVFASPLGGRTPIDPMSLDEFKDDEECNAFLADPVAMFALNNTLRLDQVNAADFALVLYPGGHGPMMDLTDNVRSQELGREVYEAGGLVSAVCHGVGAILELRLRNGGRLIQGKRVTAFSNAEEEAAGLTDMVPYLLEDKLIENGGVYEKAAELWSPRVVRDGRLITGQNPNSSTSLGWTLLYLLEDRGL